MDNFNYAAKLGHLFQIKITENRENCILTIYSRVIQPCAMAFTTKSIAFLAPNLAISLRRKVSTVFSET